jgi:hypothetical protein
VQTPVPAQRPADKSPNEHTLHPDSSWEGYLQRLPRRQGPILDFRGRPVADQEKHAALLLFDVGSRDLQQCADALIRLRAEYLFERGRHEEIVFAFTSGHRYRWNDYRRGIRPRINGATVSFTQQSAPCPPSPEALRRYLDIVYTYAGTISLARTLRPVRSLEIGTVILKSGSPGHCCIVIDKALQEGRWVYQLAEGYTPAQTIYVLKNPRTGTPWHELGTGPIQTASYRFDTYQLCRFGP